MLVGSESFVTLLYRASASMPVSESLFTIRTNLDFVYILKNARQCTVNTRANIPLSS